MDLDTYQQAWQAHSAQTRVTVDADLLLKEVQRNQRDFRALIFRRDVVEVGVALLLLPYWFYAGITQSLPWTWYLTVPVLVWIAGFILVYRMRHPKKPSDPDAPLLESAKNSLAEVENQIWLLRNVFWWYLLPPGISILAFFAHVSWLASNDWLEYALGFGTLSAFIVALYYLIYWLNQRAVRVQLEPRRQELLALLASLGNESTEEHPTTTSADVVKKTGLLERLLIVACLCFVALMLVGLAVRLSRDRSEGTGYPRLSPFAAVRWQDSQPEVKIGEEWYRLVSLDDVAAEEIVAFSRETYADRWQKRFEEDLVELLSRMGHPPQETVKLEVQSLTSSETQVLEHVPLTAANRNAIKAAAQARAKSEP